MRFGERLKPGGPVETYEDHRLADMGAGEVETYYPASHPNVLTPEEARLLQKLYDRGWDALKAGEVGVLGPMVNRLASWAEEEGH